MSTSRHPLLKHLDDTGETLTAFAKRVDLTRVHLYRIMNGRSTTTARLKQISAATGGQVPVSAFLDETEVAE